MVDTGACYGGELSAYCPETGEIRQVPGQRAIPDSLTLASIGHQLERCLP
jgi:serine/threonine protein phosphatase 1